MLCSECASSQHGSVRFCQIAGGTYRGETQAVVFARNVFYCLSGLKMLCPMQSQNNRRIKSFLCPGVGIIMFYCSYNYHCQAYFGQENVLKPTMLLLLWSWREWGVWMKKEWMSVVWWNISASLNCLSCFIFAVLGQLILESCEPCIHIQQLWSLAVAANLKKTHTHFAAKQKQFVLKLMTLEKKKPCFVVDCMLRHFLWLVCPTFEVINNTKILYREVTNECECIKWLFMGGGKWCDLDECCAWENFAFE